jgi:hypothetical protein
MKTARAQALESLGLNSGDAVYFSFTNMPAFVPGQDGKMHGTGQRATFRGLFEDENGGLAVRLDAETGEGGTLKWVLDAGDVRLAAIGNVSVPTGTRIKLS